MSEEFRAELAALVEEIKAVAYEEHMAQAEGTSNEAFVDPERLRYYLDIRLTEHGLGRFELYTHGDPAALDEMIQHLNDGYTGMRGELETGRDEDVATIIANVSGWSGTAADSFHNSYTTRLESTVNNLLQFVEELARVLAAYHAIVVHMRTDIKDIGRTTIDAFRVMDQGSATGVLKVIGVVASIVATGYFGVAPAVAQAAGAISLAAGMADAAASSGGESQVPYSVQGNMFIEVLDSMTERIGELDRLIWYEEDVISRGLDADLAFFDDAGHLREILPDRPGSGDLATLPDVGDFRTDNIEDVLRDRPEVADLPGSWQPGDRPDDFEPPAGRDLVVSIAELYVAGEFMSALAYRFQRAAVIATLVTALEDRALGTGALFGLTRHKWELARDLLRFVLVRSKDNLIDAADALRRIATSYAATEGLNAQVMAEVGRQLTDFDRPTIENPGHRDSVPPRPHRDPDAPLGG
ncbi:hypothetical protein SRB5_03030 [Streptomyces sp. RB5]|uniref:Uncharacterized protein n=1 Tax=Streptomyces smaragdinus TaxID=2585196 RepID=A0A7K0C9Y1_9ACTN|nr:WXG100 family type VII secretion target [Streptomyces smaragdinus]MQY10196.1 hypothetical protein [Streptomyces smaragdinus]